MKFFSTYKIKESCIIIGLATTSQKQNLVQESLGELKSLVSTAGGTVHESFIQKKDHINPRFFIGEGKAREISSYIENYPVDTIIFDDELSPAQILNWEQLTHVKVIDRSALILDIFAAHARSRESKTQVELAQLTYLLPRLTGQWSHLSRQVGGIGTKGPGESQLETDRRLVRARITQLKKELKRIELQRKIQRKNAGKMKRVSLVGYTNSGKSTLLHALTGADILIADQLFATLDTTTRRLRLNDHLTVLVSDTVGFINKLPHHLIASFQSTLAQAREADILLHIVDLSNSDHEDHIRTVEGILKELGIIDKPTVIVFNKVDKVKDERTLKNASQNYSNALYVSALKKIRLENIKKTLSIIFKEK